VTTQAGSFLAALDDDERRRLAELGRTRRYESGDYLFYEGDPGSTVLLIQRGWVKLATTSAEGHEHVLSISGPADVVGEVACLDLHESGRSATATALGDVVVQVISRETFLEFLERHPRALLAITRTLIGRLRGADRRRLEFGAYDTLGRVARVLHELASAHGRVDGQRLVLDPPLTQHELAGLVGASRESVVRALGELRRRGLVETGRRRLVGTRRLIWSVLGSVGGDGVDLPRPDRVGPPLRDRRARRQPPAGRALDRGPAGATQPSAGRAPARGDGGPRTGPRTGSRRTGSRRPARPAPRPHGPRPLGARRRLRRGPRPARHHR
jgi:CRP-like cAMP-binding protein